MRTLVTRAAALVGMLAICLGILVPALALTCPRAQAMTTGDSCPCCDAALPAGGPSCGFACQQPAPAGIAAANPALEESLAWFDRTARRLAGTSIPPEAPPPR